MKTQGTNAKKWIIIGVIALIVLILIGTLWGSYNGLVSGDENVKQKWANVQTAYQRRADLIPNLVSTVKGSADFEKKMDRTVGLVSITQASNVTGARMPIEKIAKVAHDCGALVLVDGAQSVPHQEPFGAWPLLPAQTSPAWP